ncbi:hypothetical protein C8F01DRAFT_1089486 [Mycena amicta]|nr:hypothetical protein C8F01DRAFT_1089486 [Mycena amicta]
MTVTVTLMALMALTSPCSSRSLIELFKLFTLPNNRFWDPFPPLLLLFSSWVLFLNSCPLLVSATHATYGAPISLLVRRVEYPILPFLLEGLELRIAIGAFGPFKASTVTITIHHTTPPITRHCPTLELIVVDDVDGEYVEKKGASLGRAAPTSHRVTFIQKGK